MSVSGGSPRPGRRQLSFEIKRQPDDATCGPACLEAVYRFYGSDVSLETLIRDIPTLDDGGTLGVLLAQNALAHGFRATVLTWNLRVFDPTWFGREEVDLASLLRRRAAAKKKAKLGFAAEAYARFIEAGGRIEFCDLASNLIRDYLLRGIPLLTGLSATFLYREPREHPISGKPDDVGGEPSGHFVVLTGYSDDRDEVFVTDPLYPNPLSVTHTYGVSTERLIGSIFLGVLTYDANLIVVEPPA